MIVEGFICQFVTVAAGAAAPRLDAMQKLRGGRLRMHGEGADSVVGEAAAVVPNKCDH